MSADVTAISAHADTLHADACALAACAERLRAVEAALEAGGAAPAWLRASVEYHVGACASAAADLETASRRLRRWADQASPPARSG
ncbi:hypothetical protein FAF44_15865 [Nonomuraea sp. MG754425]|uniref:hypothetical protein n=1 Tax=Nonomuraea sp. MG754425 TaxID=2570319 RepID=UPI001F382DC8|nr:hypothetical protein [Nonomuraea sp. MG754425]MCF6469857.1 hypothetical protein [Nonomuraea sp. MG754425]